MKATIYKLVWGDKYYIGSTIQPINLRLNSHRYRPKGLLKTIDDWSKVTILSIEEFECENDIERFQKETTYITASLEDKNCMNKRRPFTTKDEKRLQNKGYKEKDPERYAEYHRRAYEARKVRTRTCECGKIILDSNFSRHVRSHSKN